MSEYVMSEGTERTFDMRERLNSGIGMFSKQKSAEKREIRKKNEKGEIWWSNGIFFISLHLFAIYGALILSPPSQLSLPTFILCIISWQLASFGITIGYHRLWSHRAFEATGPLRVILAWMGSMGFQGSVRWWVLRHRLHHRFTDSVEHDPYSATKGLWFAHCGWIFRKPTYPRMKLIERTDLDNDPVVRFQHKYYVQIALFSGLILPTLIGAIWNDALGGLVWGGAVARLLIWHTTFCINSLAHWTGLQPYTEEVTARGNYLLAILTSGEGNHNFHHAFPKDFRNGPHPADWDPTKWIIYILHKYTSLVPSLATTPNSSILKARSMVLHSQADRLAGTIPESERPKTKEDLPFWSTREAKRRNGEWVLELVGEEIRKRRRVLVLVGGCLVDVGGYVDEHPGGRELLLSHSITPLPSTLILTAAPSDIEREVNQQSPLSSPTQHDSGYASSNSYFSSSPPMKQSHNLLQRADNPPSGESSGRSSGEDESEDGENGLRFKDATKAFFGGINNHSAAAKDKMRCLRVAVIKDV